MSSAIQTLRSLFDRFTTQKYFFLGALTILLSLLLKDPFGQRTLIPNLEPFPDTIHYIVPARSFVSGQGFNLVRDAGSIKSAVSPLYSWLLIPFYLLNSDPRVFYFANVLLSVVSIYFFFLTTKKIISNKWLVGLGLLLYSTNFYLYWYPGFAMAENLTLTLFMIGIYLLTLKVNLRNIVLGALIAASFYGAKYANAPLAVLYVIFYSIKALRSSYGKTRTKKLLKTMIAVVSLGIFISLLQYYRNATGLISASALVIKGILSGTAQSSSWFSLEYVPQNLKFYLETLMGEQRRFLWEFTPILPTYLAIMGALGLVIGITDKKTRLISGALAAMLFMQILFLSTFYSVDARYIYFAIPTLIMGILLLFKKVLMFSEKKNLKKVFYFFLVGLTGLYLATNALRIKNQVVLNLKYAETPWYYISVLELNNFFSDKLSEKPIVISPMPPYYIDYYSNGNYDLLPLSPQQEFRNMREAIWGPGDYSDLLSLYAQKIKEGRELYVAVYGLGVEGYLHEDFRLLSEEFKLTQLMSECFDLCRIYEVELHK